MKVLLASKSPRRKELLKRILPAKKILVAGSDVLENRQEGESAEAFCMRIAREKANNVWVNYGGHRGSIGAVVGADTVILFKGKVIGQPEDSDDAIRILRELNGQCHEVITGVAVLFPEKNRFTAFAVRSRVCMRRLNIKAIGDYVATGEPLDKAGAYAIQGKGRRLVAKYEGSYSNIVGLPVDELRKVLKCLG